MLDKVHLDQKNVWKIVRQVRKSFLSKNTNPICDIYSLLTDNHIKDNIETVVENLKLNTTYSTNKNVSDKILQTAADMFTYLNLCPSAGAKTLSKGDSKVRFFGQAVL